MISEATFTYIKCGGCGFALFTSYYIYAVYIYTALCWYSLYQICVLRLSIKGGPGGYKVSLYTHSVLECYIVELLMLSYNIEYSTSSTSHPTHLIVNPSMRIILGLYILNCQETLCSSWHLVIINSCVKQRANVIIYYAVE